MFIQRTPYALLVKWEYYFLNVQQRVVTCFMSANHREMSRAEGELIATMVSVHLIIAAYNTSED